MRVGADLTPAEQAEQEGLAAALREITPTLILVGIVSGAAFAIGSGIVARLLFRER